MPNRWMCSMPYVSFDISSRSRPSRPLAQGSRGLYDKSSYEADNPKPSFEPRTSWFTRFSTTRQRPFLDILVNYSFKLIYKTVLETNPENLDSRRRLWT